MQACAQGRYSNEFRHAWVGKAHLIGMSLASLMNNRSAGAMAYRLHHEASRARRANTRQAASGTPSWSAWFLVREAVLPAHNKCPYQNIHREGCLDDLVWRILST